MIESLEKVLALLQEALKAMPYTGCATNSSIQAAIDNIEADIRYYQTHTKGN